MAGKDLHQELNALIQSCKDQGILSDLFDQVRQFQDETQPKFVTEIIDQFINQADDDIAQINDILGEVNYKKVFFLAHRVYGGSISGMGGSGMNNALNALRAAARAEIKAECLETLEVVNREYQTLKENLNNIAQLERAIYDKKAKADSSDNED